MSVWGKEDDQEFMKGVMALLGAGAEEDKASQKQRRKGAFAGKGTHRKKKDEAEFSAPLDADFKHALGGNMWDDLSSPEKSIDGPSLFNFGENDADGGVEDRFATSLQQDIEREMAKKQKAKTAAISAQEKRCKDLIRTEATWMDKEIEMCRTKEKKENDSFVNSALKLRQECDKAFRQWTKSESAAKKTFDASVAEEAEMQHTFKQEAVKLVNKTENAVKEIRERLLALQAEKKRKYEELEQALDAKRKLARQVIIKIEQMV